MFTLLAKLDPYYLLIKYVLNDVPFIRDSLFVQTVLQSLRISLMCINSYCMTRSLCLIFLTFIPTFTKFAKVVSSLGNRLTNTVEGMELRGIKKIIQSYQQTRLLLQSANYLISNCCAGTFSASLVVCVLLNFVILRGYNGGVSLLLIYAVTADLLCYVGLYLTLLPEIQFYEDSVDLLKNPPLRLQLAAAPGSNSNSRKCHLKEVMSLYPCKIGQFQFFFVQNETKVEIYYTILPHTINLVLSLPNNII